MGHLSYMKISWHFIVFAYLLHQVQPQTNSMTTAADNMASSMDITTDVMEEVTSVVTMDDVTTHVDMASQGATTATTTAMPATAATTAGDAQNSMTTATNNITTESAVSSDSPMTTSNTGMAQTESADNSTDTNSTILINVTTMAMNVSQTNEQTSHPSSETATQPGNSMTTQGQDSMVTSATPITCWFCNDTNCANSSNWKTCTSAEGCTITYSRTSKTMQLSCASSCSGQFPNGQFTESECGFCCKTSNCNNYTIPAVEKACNNMTAQSKAPLLETSIASLILTTIQIILLYFN